MLSDFAYITAEKGVKGRWSKDWLRSWLLSKVRKAHQRMLLTKFESSASCAVGEFLVLCCPSDSLNIKMEEYQFVMYLSTPTPPESFIFPMFFCSYHLYFTNGLSSVYIS
jgi:hypothetical protein